MRIAVTAMGKDLDAALDPRFGRAQNILILDEKGELLEALDNNKNINAMQGAGIQAARTMADHKVEVLLTGHCGPNAFQTLQAAGIKIVVGMSGTVREAFGRFSRNETTYAASPDTGGHW